MSVSVTVGAEAEIVGRAASVTDAFDQAVRLGPDVLVVDLRMPEGERAHLFQPRSPPDAQLSPQERRVLELVAEGRTNREIAEALDLSHKTVKNYLSNAFQKLHVGRRVTAATAYRKLQKGDADK